MITNLDPNTWWDISGLNMASFDSKSSILRINLNSRASLLFITNLFKRVDDKSIFLKREIIYIIICSSRYLLLMQQGSDSDGWYQDVHRLEHCKEVYSVRFTMVRKGDRRNGSLIFVRTSQRSCVTRAPNEHGIIYNRSIVWYLRSLRSIKSSLCYKNCKSLYLASVCTVKQTERQSGLLAQAAGHKATSRQNRAGYASQFESERRTQLVVQIPAERRMDPL